MHLFAIWQHQTYVIARCRLKQSRPKAVYAFGRNFIKFISYTGRPLNARRRTTGKGKYAARTSPSRPFRCMRLRPNDPFGQELLYLSQATAPKAKTPRLKTKRRYSAPFTAPFSSLLSFFSDLESVSDRFSERDIFIVYGIERDRTEFRRGYFSVFVEHAFVRADVDDFPYYQAVLRRL